jgi:Zn-dependent peptidase ImmA (M78 family)
MNAIESANYVLDNYWDKQYPVNLIKIIENMGVDCQIKDLSDIKEGVDGALYIATDKAPIIFLHNTPKNKERMRFTLAHELGHYVDMKLNRPDELNKETSIIEYRNKSSSMGIDPKEIFANQFAANLLMPLFAVQKLKEANINYQDMANLFHVSNQAMMIRLTSV